MRKSLIFLMGIFFCIKISSQVIIKSHTKPVITSNGIFGNTEKISETIIQGLTETEIARSSKEVNKFAEPKFVDIPFLEKASKETIGDYIIFRHKVVGLKATSITIKFNRLSLSEKAELYIYNNEGTVVTGPITAKENISEDRLWSSNSFQGNSVILELRVPTNEEDQNDLYISKVLLGLPKRIIKPETSDSLNFGNFDASSSCNLNVVCSQGNAWVNETKAVCLIEKDNGGRASGALLMNTCNSNRPFVLTAWHVITGVEPTNWTFIFGWWSSTCTPNTNNQSALLFNGAIFRASYQQSDMALVELTQKPDLTLDLAYLGWTRSSTIPATSVGIHHPKADQMKISFANSSATIGNTYTFTNTAWRVLWNLGTSEDGSSGSPLFDADHRVIGQLYSGTQPIGPPCNELTGGNNYGRFDLSWDGGGTNDTRLSNWLDPINSGAMTTNTTTISNFWPAYLSLSITGGASTICSGASTYTLNGAPAGVTITWTISNPSIASLSSNGNQATVTMNGNGSIYLTATVGGACFSNNTKTTTIRLGNYLTSEFDIYSEPVGQPFCNNQLVTFGPAASELLAPSTYYNWSWGSGWTYVSGLNTRYLQLRVNTGGYYSYGTVILRAGNDCGTSDLKYKIFYFNSGCYNPYRISPNPSTGMIRIEPQIDKKEIPIAEIREIELIDRSGLVRFKQKLSKGQNEMNLNVSFLPNDVYILRIFDGQIWHSNKVVVLH